MIIVDANKVELGISKTMIDKVPLAGIMYELNSDITVKSVLTTDLHVLFLALMKKYGTVKAIDMIQNALEGIFDDLDIVSKESKDHD